MSDTSIAAGSPGFNRLRIAIDARVALEDARGWGRYAEELLFALGGIEGIEVQALLPRSKAARDAGDRLRGRRLTLHRGIEQQQRAEEVCGEVDVYHSLTRFALPTSLRPVIATVHDVAPLGAPPSRPALREPTIAAIRALTMPGHHMVAVSEFTRQELRRAMDIAIDDVPVVHHGVPRAMKRARRTTRRNDVVLYVGGAGEPKNVGALLAAMHTVRRARACELWVIGAPDWGWAAFEPLPPWAHALGLVDDDALVDCYDAATVLAFPSRYEGFGLPLLEAFARGLPVACSDIAPFREIGGDAAALFDPTSPDAIARTLLGLLESAEERRRLTELGLARSARFEWEAVAREMVALYRRWSA